MRPSEYDMVPRDSHSMRLGGRENRVRRYAGVSYSGRGAVEGRLRSAVTTTQGDKDGTCMDTPARLAVATRQAVQLLTYEIAPPRRTYLSGCVAQPSRYGPSPRRLRLRPAAAAAAASWSPTPFSPGRRADAALEPRHQALQGRDGTTVRVR